MSLFGVAKIGAEPGYLREKAAFFVNSTPKAPSTGPYSKSE